MYINNALWTCITFTCEASGTNEWFLLETIPDFIFFSFFSLFLSLGSELSSELLEDSYSSGGEALDGDDEDEAAAPGNVAEEATSSKDGPSSGWADAMAKVLNKKIPQNKSTILAKNKTLEKEREKKKQERQERKLRVRKRCSIPWAVTVRWATCMIGSEHCPRSLLRHCQFCSVSFIAILSSLFFF